MNPRSDLGDLTELARSIATVGIIEPLIVIENAGLGDVGHTVVAGHRRLAAAKLAGLDHVPCVVRDFTGEEAMEVAVIENLQRSDLTPLDEGRAFRWLVDLGRTQVEIAERVGCSQSHISRRLALMKLPDKAATLLTEGRLTVRQAEQLADVADDDLDDVVSLVVDHRAARDDQATLIPEWAVDEAIKKLAAKRKHDKAEQLGIASGLKRVTEYVDRSYGSYRPCKKAEATHWYVGPNDVTVTWARTANADAKAKGIDTTPAARVKSAWEIEQEADRRIEAFVSTVAEKALRDPHTRTTLITATKLALFEDLTATDRHHWHRGVDLQPLDPCPPATLKDPELYVAISIAFALSEAKWKSMTMLRTLVAYGYRPGEGETLPDGFELPPAPDVDGDAAGIPAADAPAGAATPSKARKAAAAPAAAAKKAASKPATVKKSAARKPAPKKATSPAKRAKR